MSNPISNPWSFLMRFWLHSLYILLFSSLLIGCGYQMGSGSPISSYRTISVPYVEGDRDGCLTSAIIKEISTYTTLSYRNCGGALTLKVKILDYYDDNIGFRYDLKKSGEPRHIIIPDETRTTIEVEVLVIEASSGAIILGPTIISAYTEYDHDYYSNRDAVNVFSLGQLTDIDEAYDAAQIPLNKRLAEQIVSYVQNSW